MSADANTEKYLRLSRRGLLVAAAGSVVLPSFAKAQSIEAIASESRLPGRVKSVFELRIARAQAQALLAAAKEPQQRNSDEREIPGYAACFSKGLAKQSNGLVQPAAYENLRAACASGQAREFNAMAYQAIALQPIFPFDPYSYVRLVSPMASMAYTLQGMDPQAGRILPAPSFASAQTATDMVELYWRALVRDVAFSEFELDTLVNAAAREFNKLTVRPGPSQSSVITPQSVFRGPTLGDVTGPFISQFLLRTVPQGAYSLEQRLRYPVAGNDFLHQWNEWLSVQEPNAALRTDRWLATPRYIYSLRGLAQFAHVDYAYQAALNAALICLSFGNEALADTNPYKRSGNQQGFSTFGGPDILDAIAAMGKAALLAAWHQKWVHHRRLRPEEYGARVDRVVAGELDLPIHAEIIRSEGHLRNRDRFGSSLLPMAYPEGCPMHPSYPGGHSTFGGACVTVMKAYFNVDYVLTNPSVANRDGTQLIPWTGPVLTIGNELDKLAGNITHGRDSAGVHYRSDGVQGLQLGEQVALHWLMDQSVLYNERFDGFRVRKFDGTLVVIRNGKIALV